MQILNLKFFWNDQFLNEIDLLKNFFLIFLEQDYLKDYKYVHNLILMKNCRKFKKIGLSFMKRKLKIDKDILYNFGQFLSKTDYNADDKKFWKFIFREFISLKNLSSWNEDFAF